MSETKTLRGRFLRGERLIGTFIKSPAPHVVEILGTSGFDFLVIDAEHAPFDRRSVDAALLAARAVGIPTLVRTANTEAANILAALDDGATGIVGPHVGSVESARALADACRYSGKRGFSGSPRAAGFGGREMWDQVDQADENTLVLAMIEDMSAVEAIDEILAITGLDGIFIGRADLAVSSGDRLPGAPHTLAATDRVLRAADRAGKAVMLFVTDSADAVAMQASMRCSLVVSSDQGLMRGAALELFERLASTARSQSGGSGVASC